VKRIVICCDGTWNRADQESPTNVVRTAYLIAKSDADVEQVVYYDQGVGTGNSLDRLTGGAFGNGLEENIHEAYRFLVANFEPHDELFLFGFSRGAYTVRSLGGMIRKCGILRRSSVDQYQNAVDLYRDGQHPDEDEPKLFRKNHSVVGDTEIPIAYLGVWDTVGALGIPLAGLRALTRRPHQFHDTELSGSVKRARQALAIDEQRKPFAPTLWRHQPKPGQLVEQVWFAGVHSDIGGGYLDRGISDLALRWILDGAIEAGLHLDVEALEAFPLTPDSSARLHDSMNLFFRTLGSMDRPIGLMPRDPRDPGSEQLMPDATQSVHESVRRRWDDDGRYRPRALRAYFERSGDPRGGGSS